MSLTKSTGSAALQKGTHPPKAKPTVATAIRAYFIRVNKSGATVDVAPNLVNLFTNLNHADGHTPRNLQPKTCAGINGRNCFPRSLILPSVKHRWHSQPPALAQSQRLR